MIWLPVTYALLLGVSAVVLIALAGYVIRQRPTPRGIAGVGLLLLWKYLFNPDFGLINRTLGLVGINGPGWLQDYGWAKPSIMLMGFWGAMGGMSMVIYLAGLQGIPQELYEAALT